MTSFSKSVGFFQEYLKVRGTKKKDQEIVIKKYENTCRGLRSFPDSLVQWKFLNRQKIENINFYGISFKLFMQKFIYFTPQGLHFFWNLPLFKACILELWKLQYI